MGGVRVSKLENGKIDMGVVVDDVQADERSAFKMVLFDEDDDDDEVDKLWQNWTLKETQGKKLIYVSVSKLTLIILAKLNQFTISFELPSKQNYVACSWEKC